MACRDPPVWKLHDTGSGLQGGRHCILQEIVVQPIKTELVNVEKIPLIRLTHA
jgi:hypothetical protein